MLAEGGTLLTELDSVMEAELTTPEEAVKGDELELDDPQDVDGR